MQGAKIVLDDLVVFHGVRSRILRRRQDTRDVVHAKLVNQPGGIFARLHCFLLQRPHVAKRLEMRDGR